ncbi:832_t:CDS:2 [Funneliformis caledonium]|uniref:832_t:CDS:1 n=1 Tax=Funneliformis caledonium TaxID=1117310 RepID=A0A9N8YYA5_9GLOM|nr:832_t:CDS:2 [Funneliformis caledonium]
MIINVYEEIAINTMFEQFSTDVGPFGIDGLSFTNLGFKTWLDQFALKSTTEFRIVKRITKGQPYEPIILE